MIALTGSQEAALDAVQRAIDETNNTVPVGVEIAFSHLVWQDQPAGFGEPQQQFNPMARRCDVFIGLLADRFGTKTQRGKTGFAEEFEIAVERRRTSSDPEIAIFFQAHLDTRGADPEQVASVLHFKQRLQHEQQLVYADFEDAIDLERKVRRVLQTRVYRLMGHTPPSQASELIGRDSLDIKAGPPQDAQRVEPDVPEFVEIFTQPSSWDEALLQGPLRETGQAEAAEHARELEAEQPLEAAQELVKVAEVLAARGHAPVADVLREQAAALLEREGRRADAAQLLESVLEGLIARGSQRAPHLVERLARLLPEDGQWRAGVLSALVDWPENPENAVEALNEGLQQLGGQGEHWPHQSMRVATGLAEILNMHGRREEAIDVVSPLRGHPLSPGFRVSLELEALDALAATGRQAEAAEGWRQLRALEGLGPEQRATVLARHGIALAMEGEVEGATQAFLDAAVAWQRVKGAGDQVAECYFASQASAGLNAEHRPAGEALRPLAAVLRGAASTPAARADDLIRSGMGSRIRDKLYEARRSFWLAHAEHRRAGNLRGQMATLELLGELHVAADRPVAAVWAYVRAGRERRAAEAAEQVDQSGMGRLTDVLDLHGSRWTRAASLAVLAKVGRRLPAEKVRELVPSVLQEASKQWYSLMSPQPAMRAQEALGALCFDAPDHLREQVLGTLRDLVRGRYVGTARSAAEALILLTNAGGADETQILTQVCLEDDGLANISSLWLGGQLAQHPEQATKLSDAAKRGNRFALEAAAAGDLPAHDAELVEVCTVSIRELISRPVVEEIQSSGGTVQRRTGIGNWEPSGLIGRFVAPDLRAEMSRYLFDIITGAEAPFETRASSAGALFNLAPGLDASLRAELAESLMPRACDFAPSSDWDEMTPNPPDPFSRVQMRVPGALDLRATVLEAIGALAADLDPVPGDLDRAVLAAIAAPDSKLARAGWLTLARCPQLELPVDAELGLRAADPQVRTAALRCWTVRNERPPVAQVLEALLTDPSLAVRLTLVMSARDMGKAWRPTLERLAVDPDAYVRALARLP